MTDVQRFAQSSYSNELYPASGSDAHYMFYKDHTVIVSLLREQLAWMERQLTLSNTLLTQALTTNQPR
jgi:hypothetical protein